MNPQVTDGVVDRALGKILYRGEKHEAHEQKETPKQESAEHLKLLCPKCNGKLVVKGGKHCHHCGYKLG